MTDENIKRLMFRETLHKNPIFVRIIGCCSSDQRFLLLTNNKYINEFTLTLFLKNKLKEKILEDNVNKSIPEEFLYGIIARIVYFRELLISGLDNINEYQAINTHEKRLILLHLLREIVVFDEEPYLELLNCLYGKNSKEHFYKYSRFLTRVKNVRLLTDKYLLEKITLKKYKKELEFQLKNFFNPFIKDFNKMEYIFDIVYIICAKDLRDAIN